MTKRKHLSEFAVNLCSKSILLISSSQLTSDGEMGPKEKAISDNCHIYLICRVPMLSFDVESFAYDGDVATGRLLYKVSGEQYEIPFRIPFPLLDGAVSLRLSDYPHREICTYNTEDEIVRHMPANALAFGYGLHADLEHVNTLHVLYVGQAFGDGDRTAIERLRSHSTLQKILAEAQYESPDFEIFLFLIEYDHYRIITSMNADALVTGEKDMERFLSIHDNPLSENQQICLAEAGLIRYFQPKYNKVYKKSFPREDQKILADCYDLDFSALVVEINTEELLFRLESDTKEPGYHHIANFSLVDPKERWGFFHFFGNDKSIDLDDVIS